MTTPTSDLVKWLRGVTIGTLLHLRVDADPSPVTRNVSRSGHIIHGKLYAAFYAECQRQFAAQRPYTPIAEVPLAIAVEVIRPRPKAGKFPIPVGDWDNLVKGPTDAVKKAGIWADDFWVSKALVEKRYANPGETPGVNLSIGVVA